MNVLAFVPYLYDTVPGQRFRVEQWARHLAGVGVHFQFVPFESVELKRIYHTRSHLARKLVELTRSAFRRLREVPSTRDGWDVIYLYREMLPVGPPFLERFLTRQRIPILYDFDDAIFLLDTSEANRWFRWLKSPRKTESICRWSNHIIVGNRTLQEYASRHTPNVSVIPTTIDTEVYQPKPAVEIAGSPVIGWSGSLTTLKHLKTIGPVLQTLTKSLRFRLKVIGGEPFHLPGVGLESQPWDPATEVRELQSFDIGVMPLPDDPWARGKCGLKILQYMAVGVPTIASPVGINTEIIQDGKNGFLARTEEEWGERIRILASDLSLRRRFSMEGRRTVEERYSAKVQAPRLLEILRQVSRS